MPSPTTTRRAELYLRGDTYGTFDAQQAVLNRIYELEAAGEFDSATLADEWQRIRTANEDCRSGAIATYREFAEWARRNGQSLSPAFERRQRAFMGLDRVDDVVVFPVVSLAVYEDSRLRAVFPCADGEETYSVGDCLDAFERGDPDWLAQFDGVTVDRTEPWLATGIRA
jgi:hypothetical protein